MTRARARGETFSHSLRPAGGDAGPAGAAFQTPSPAHPPHAPGNSGGPFKLIGAVTMHGFVHVVVHVRRSRLIDPLTVRADSISLRSVAAGASVSSSSERTRPLTVDTSRCAAVPVGMPTVTSPLTALT